jgi:cation diffusion facilitator CzcD-associated flavoprotein CzcO
LFWLPAFTSVGVQCKVWFGCCNERKELIVENGLVELAIIGSGFGGLGAGVMAIEQGIESFVILERAKAVGGTWRDNTYPGCACDIPSHLYSFSFAQNSAWSRSYPA